MTVYEFVVCWWLLGLLLMLPPSAARRAWWDLTHAMIGDDALLGVLMVCIGAWSAPLAAVAIVIVQLRDMMGRPK